MEVYYTTDETIWGHSKQEEQLTKVSINRTVLWEDQEIFIPAVYVGVSGAMLDLCVKIPSGDMIRFLKKWENPAESASLKNPEEYEQFESENPSCKHFNTELCLNGTPLALAMGSNLFWYSADVVHQTEAKETLSQARTAPAANDGAVSPWQNDPDAELVRTAYHCGADCCWQFGRFVYQWTDAPVLSPQEVTLLFRARPKPVTAGHFVTVSGSGTKPVELLKAVHPTTGREYTITQRECRLTRHSFDNTKGISYPEYSQSLIYSISPSLAPELYEIADCSAGDTPRRTDAPGIPCSHTAAFSCAPSPAPDKRLAVSSYHFDRFFSEVCWRLVFYVTPKEDLEVHFPIF